MFSFKCFVDLKIEVRIRKSFNPCSGSGIGRAFFIPAGSLPYNKIRTNKYQAHKSYLNFFFKLGAKDRECGLFPPQLLNWGRSQESPLGIGE